MANTVENPVAQQVAAAQGKATPELAPGAVPANSSLYVGDLSPEVTEAQLFELFSQVGPVASIRVCRDAITRHSLGYAYVNFNSGMDPGAAERAIDNLNYQTLSGRPMRIMWSHRDPAFRKSGVGNIFIKNLDKSISNKELHDTFNAFGRILSCKVAMDSQGNSKGYAFIHFDKEEDATLAIEKVNGMQLKSEIVWAGPFLKYDDRQSNKETTFTNIYVNNIPLEWAEADLKSYFEKIGTVTSAVVQMGDDGKSKGFGFVNFENADDAVKAVEECEGNELVEGKPMQLNRAQKKAERANMLKNKFEQKRAERLAKIQGMNLYVKNLDDDVTDDKLREEFAAFGNITSAKVMKDAVKGTSKGFGFVCFSTQEEATRGVTEMNGKLLCGKPVYVALAQRKDVRRAQLEQQHSTPSRSMGGRGMQGGPQGPVPGMYGPGMYPPQMMMGQGRGPMMAGYPQHMMGGRGPMMGNTRGRGNVMGRGGRGAMGRGGRGAMGRGGRGNQVMNQTPVTQVPPPVQAPDFQTSLASAAPEQQKQLIGERIFPLVQQLQPAAASKITGMLLEMDNEELLMLLQDQSSIEEKVSEALKVLMEHSDE